MPVIFQKDIWQSFQRYWNPKQEEPAMGMASGSHIAFGINQMLWSGPLHPSSSVPVWWQDRASPGAPGTCQVRTLFWEHWKHTSSEWRSSGASQEILGHRNITDSVLPPEKEAASLALSFFSLLLEIKCCRSVLEKVPDRGPPVMS